MSIRAKSCVFVIFVISLILSGCESNAAPEQTIPDEISDQELMNPVISEKSDSFDEITYEEPEIEDTPDEDIIPEEADDIEAPSVSEDEILNFVDVFGNEYETKINPNIEKHPYQDAAFIRDGTVLRYEDDNYRSRPGIDVSHHQGDINWQAVADQGFEFAIIRIGYRGYGQEGKVCEDKKFREYVSEAKKAGLDVGVYFFSQAINRDEALEEADFVLQLLDGIQLDLPVTYDPESILDDEARTDNVSGEQFTENTIAFCEQIKNAGYEPMIYSNMLWEAFEFDLEKLEGIPIWYADYEPLPQTPYDFQFFQYSNEGRVNGISGVCDLDIQMIKIDN